MGNECIFVLGMHRSGTSALTGVMSLLGIHVGDSLMPATEANPKGFWEHAGIADCHDRVLEALGSSWHDERHLPERWWTRAEMEPFRQELVQILQTDFTGMNRWMIKDPRMCRLLPLWRPLLDAGGYSPHVIMILRDPREVAKSLARRDGISEERSHLLWLQHVLEAEKWTRGSPRTLVTFEGLLKDWRATMNQISTVLSLDLAINGPEVRRRVEAFLEPTLRHHTTVESPSGHLPRLALAAYQTCINARNPDQLETALAPIAAKVMEFAELVIPWSGEIQTLWHTRMKAIAAHEAFTKELARVKGTVSWRITAPLRVAWNIGRKLIDKR